MGASAAAGELRAGGRLSAAAAGVLAARLCLRAAERSGLDRRQPGSHALVQAVVELGARVARAARGGVGAARRLPGELGDAVRPQWSQVGQPAKASFGVGRSSRAACLGVAVCCPRRISTHAAALATAHRPGTSATTSLSRATEASRCRSPTCPCSAGAPSRSAWPTCTRSSARRTTSRTTAATSSASSSRASARARTRAARHARGIAPRGSSPPPYMRRAVAPHPSAPSMQAPRTRSRTRTGAPSAPRT